MLCFRGIDLIGKTGQTLTIKTQDLIGGDSERNKFQCKAVTGYHAILSNVATVVVVTGSNIRDTSSLTGMSALV